MKLQSVFAALLAALSVAACAAIPTPPPGAVGQVGAVQTDPKDATREVAVERIALYGSPDLSNCKARTAMTFVHALGVPLPQPALVGPTEGGQIYDIPTGRGVLQMDCQTAGGGWETRKVETLQRGGS